MNPVYDDIGVKYSVNRRTDPRIAAQINTQLRGATRILNIGAGAGSYEPEDVALVAVEPSSRMIAQRAPNAHPVHQASAESLPFEDKTFSHVMTVLSMHHWSDQAKAFEEINRVATDRFVAVTWNPEAESFWLTRDYFPEIHAADTPIFPRPAQFSEHFDNVEIVPLQIPEDCEDGFLAAYWKRPRAYLSEHVRRSMSPFAKINHLSEGLKKLEQDLDSGEWEERNAALLSATAFDAGYCIISAKTRQCT